MDNSAESSLLYAARNGDIESVKSLVSAQKENGELFNINCTGVYEHKSVLCQIVLQMLCSVPIFHFINWTGPLLLGTTVFCRILGPVMEFVFCDWVSNFRRIPGNYC